MQTATDVNFRKPEIKSSAANLNILPSISDAQIEFALSGGGVRAAVFHLGVLKYFAKLGLLGNVLTVSTVSGGTLVTGLIFSNNASAWPVDEAEFVETHNKVKFILVNNGLQLNYILRMLNPLNWRHIFSRANVLADSLKNTWDIKGTLGQLPAIPLWIVNGTNLETGRRWRFQSGPKGTMGDGATGYWRAVEFPLSKAMAASAAFPGGVAPLVVEGDPNAVLSSYNDEKNNAAIESGNKRWHIADGGIYDNLGLEPLFDATTRKPRNSNGRNFIIVSDAGLPLKFSNWGVLAQALGIGSRTVDVIYAQGRNMRARTFVGAITSGTANGLFLKIAESREEAILNFTKNDGAPSISGSLGPALSKAQVSRAAMFSTTLRRPSPSDFELLERHGYETAETQWVLYGQAQFARTKAAQV